MQPDIKEPGPEYDGALILENQIVETVIIRLFEHAPFTHRIIVITLRRRVCAGLVGASCVLDDLAGNKSVSVCVASAE